MKDFLEYLLKDIVDDPDSVKVEEGSDEMGDVLFVDLKEEDKALVIGKNGRNIRALRNLVSIIGKKQGERAYIKIVD